MYIAWRGMVYPNRRLQRLKVSTSSDMCANKKSNMAWYWAWYWWYHFEVQLVVDHDAGWDKEDEPIRLSQGGL